MLGKPPRNRNMGSLQKRQNGFIKTITLAVPANTVPSLNLPFTTKQTLPTKTPAFLIKLITAFLSNLTIKYRLPLALLTTSNSAIQHQTGQVHILRPITFRKLYNTNHPSAPAPQNQKSREKRNPYTNYAYRSPNVRF